jgi:hypothetical protein
MPSRESGLRIATPPEWAILNDPLELCISCIRTPKGYIFGILDPSSQNFIKDPRLNIYPK